MMDFSKRNTETELMDDPAVDGRILAKVYRDIDWVNRVLGGNKITIRAVRDLITENPRPFYTLVDMGSGNGAMLRQIVRWGRKNGFELKAIGLDLSANAIQIARAESIDFPEISYLEKDILKLSPEDFQCDILLCTLTMHHFKNEQIPFFLNQFVRLAKIGVVINDLQRSKIAYYLFKCFSFIFINTKIAKNDGLTSIESGFTKSELLGLTQKIGHTTHKINWKWAFRYVWVMTPDRLT